MSCCIMCIKYIIQNIDNVCIYTYIYEIMQCVSINAYIHYTRFRIIEYENH